MTQGTKTIIVAVVILLVGTLFILVGKSKQTNVVQLTPTPAPTVVTQQPTVQPTVQLSPAPSGDQVQNCTKTDVSATAAFDAAAGNVYGTFTIKNTSAHSCEVPLNNYLVLNYDKSVKNLEIKYPVAGAGAMAKQYVLKQGQSLKAQVHYPNGPQCQGPVKQTAITYTFMTSPQDSVIFSDEIGKTEMQINICESPSDITTVDVSAFTP
jgi:hypothetical protein